MALNYTLAAFAVLSDNPKMPAKKLAEIIGTRSNDYADDLKCFFRHSRGTLQGMRLSRKYRGRIPPEAWPAE